MKKLMLKTFYFIAFSLLFTFGLTACQNKPEVSEQDTRKEEDSSSEQATPPRKEVSTPQEETMVRITLPSEWEKVDPPDLDILVVAGKGSLSLVVLELETIAHAETGEDLNFAEYVNHLKSEAIEYGNQLTFEDSFEIDDKKFKVFEYQPTDQNLDFIDMMVAIELSDGSLYGIDIMARDPEEYNRNELLEIVKTFKIEG